MPSKAPRLLVPGSFIYIEHRSPKASRPRIARILAFPRPGCLYGSVLLDRVLSVERVHGSNAGSFQAQLKNVRSISEQGEKSRLAMTSIMAYYSRNAAGVFQELVWRRRRFPG